MAVYLPEVAYLYQNHSLDNTRWDYYRPRPDDIVIATSYKSGTTWMQMIVMHLIFQDLQPHPIWELSPWLDNNSAPVEGVIERLDAQEHRRFIKSHLPLDGLPYHREVKYIVVGRDARDVFMSLWNHYSHFTKATYQHHQMQPGLALPQCPTDIRQFWQQWMGSGWFGWESEGYPFWSNMRHMQTWWNFRQLDNILLVHFNALLDKLEGEIHRIADFLDIRVSADLVAQIAQAVTFANVKQNAETLLPDLDNGFIGGAQTFIHKGTNGRWREVLSEEDLLLYKAAVLRELSPDCADWLETGERS